jgi:type I restriction enzyme S subunit
MKPYPEYKDSGVEWIGEIPVGWETRRLASLGLFSKGNGIKKDEVKPTGSPCIRYGEIYTKYNRVFYNPISFIDEETSLNCISIQKGDVLFAGSGESEEEIGKTLVYYGENDIFAGGDIIILKLIQGLNPLFISYLMVSNGVNHQKSRNAKGGIIVHIYPKQLREIQVSIPPFPEQTKIANFLDTKTQQIDKLIQNKEQKIKLLQEKRTAVINQAVTKGLNPDAEMKDSGVEWIGEIPKGWKKKKIKHLTSKIGSGVTPKGGAEVYKTSGIPILRSQNIHFDGLHLSEVAFITREIHESMYRSQVKPNDILLNITGASLGRCCVVPDNFSEANVNQHVCILRTLTDLDSSYLNYCLSSNVGQTQIWMGENGTAREGLNFESLGNITLFTPSFYEQTKIVSDLDTKTQQIDQLISKEQRKIELLKEYRQSLISDAVTGKIDVRDVA